MASTGKKALVEVSVYHRQPAFLCDGDLAEEESCLIRMERL